MSGALPRLGLPHDPAQWIALALAIAAIPLAPRLLRARSRLALALAALAAAALSAAYVVVYLRGGPRIIDAASYFLEARALSRGHLAFPVPEPEASYLGRFLVRAPGGDAAVLFPPGWPAVLALGFLAGAPLAVGPLLAAALTVVTADLAAQIADDRPSLPTLAAVFSVISAALRYHTADTMSHGLAALCFAAALTLAMRALGAPRARARWLAALAGLCAGWLFATRPTSALALGAPLAFLLHRERAWRLLPALALGAVPGAALLLAHQHAATGAWLASTQRAYYAVADGPPDCFRYGFGAGVGCLGEHGDFVRSRLADGYGFLAAAGTTLRRLKMHLVDPLNLEPLALLVPLGAYLARGSARGRALGIALVAQVAAYAPFYFDGNYPAGGARFLCDLLPIEHALAASAVITLARRRALPERWPAVVIALSLAGFAFRAGFDHAQLRDREGGRPFFEPSALAQAGVTRGLVFLDSDHGFALAFDPAPSSGLAFARRRGDDLDRMAWEALGRPPAFRYRFHVPPEGLAKVAVTPLALTPITGDAPLSVEGESLWPPRSQERGWAWPEWAAGTGASGDRILALHPAPAGGRAAITLGLPRRWFACRPIHPHLLGDERGEARVIDAALLTLEGASVALDRVEAGPREKICSEHGSMRFP